MGPLPPLIVKKRNIHWLERYTNSKQQQCFTTILEMTVIPCFHQRLIQTQLSNIFIKKKQQQKHYFGMFSLNDLKVTGTQEVRRDRHFRHLEKKSTAGVNISAKPLSKE